MDSGTFNDVNQLTAVNPGGAMEFTGTLSEFATVTLDGTAATLDSSNNWAGTADVATGSNTIALVATDASGNATSKTITVTVTGNEARTLVYDDNGNLIDNGDGQTYTWDAANRLTKITYSDGSYSTFVYNGLSQRVEIRESNASGTTTSDKYFAWAGGAQPAEERDASNAVTKRFYAQGEQIGGTSYYYTKDHLGSIREMTTSSATIVGRNSYDPYGRITEDITTTESTFGYTGMYRHATSGLNLTLYRAYDPNLGRWISRDPIGERGGLNLYGYVVNNSINLLDLFGLFKGIKDTGTSTDYSVVPTNDGVFQVAKHGNQYSVYKYGDERFPESADELAREIMSDPDYVTGMPVELYSCNTGNPMSSDLTDYNYVPFAQKLANALGADVTAPDDEITVYSDGSIIVRNGGQFVTYHPVK